MLTLIANPFRLLIFMLLLSMQTMGQYFITLEGRQFKNGPDNFYPLVCDYSFEIIFNGPNGSGIPPLSSLYLSPSRNYGIGSPFIQIPNNNFDFDNAADALAHIDADFLKIKSMGFNAIRTHGITATIRSQPAASFFYEVIPNYHTGLVQYPGSIAIDIGPNYNYIPNHPPPAYSPNGVTKLWDFYDQIFTLADAHGLKVLLDVGGGTIGSNYFPSHHTAYANYLSALANHFKNTTSLMAYVVIEEPDFAGNPLNSGNTENKKEAICNYTTEWYDAIKGTAASPNDPNHLVTASCVNLGTIFEWDPAVMKLDFFSPHIYPKPESYEGNSVLESYKRTLGYIQWLRDNCPMPWMTGETGFSACDDSYFGNSPTTWTPSILNPPDDDGSLSDQFWFADNILDEIRNAGGSGFSWWNYQENWWPFPSQEGYGLIDHLGNDKPVVAAFSGYLNANTQQPPPVSPFNAPANYYNPYNTGGSAPGYSYNTANANALNGDIKDANTGQGIKDAFVYAWNWLENLDVNNTPVDLSDDDPVYSSLYTFTDIVGHFQIVPYNYKNPTFANPHRISAIRVSATGAERETTGPWYNNAFYSSTINLDRHNNEYNASIQNVTVNAGFKNFRGRNSLNANNVTFLSAANSEITALNEININSYFDANIGCEVHIFTSKFQECPSYQSFTFTRMTSDIDNTTDALVEDLEKGIEIDFKPGLIEAYLDIKPNPSEGIFLFDFFERELNDSLIVVKIFDGIGNKIHHTYQVVFIL
jgi:hypothetical protein